jgi:tricorn protease
MTMMRSAVAVLACLAALIGAAPAFAQIDARMLRNPDVSATQIAFVYAGDIWVVPKTGGVAVRLSSPRGEEQNPRFSPDGSQIAFTANYDGNLDAYVVSSQGGDPVRLTHHPMPDRVVDWHPDGKRVLFASSRESGRQRYNQFYLVGATGGMPEKLKVPYGEAGSFSPDGSSIAYVPQTQANRTWKRYRGGWSPDIWTFNLTSLASSNVSKSVAVDEFPMWHGETIYFMSDRGAGQRQNLWALDRRNGATRQVTDFRDYDVASPSLGPNDIVFSAGGRLYRLELAGEKVVDVPVQVVTDRSTLKPRAEKVAGLIESASISPTGKRAAFEARGEIFSVPAEHGPVMTVTRTSGVAERYPRWSPDGKTLAYWSDRSGEYELTLRPADGTGTEKSITTLGPGFRYAPHWSPDSTRIAFVDQDSRLRIVTVANGMITEIDKSPFWVGHGGLESFVLRWSADSRWLTWSRAADTSGNRAIFLYDVTKGTKHQATSGYFTDSHPVFDPDGKYLFFLSDRSFTPVYGDFDNSWTYPNATLIVAAPLRADVPSPLAPRNDTEEPKKDDDKKDDDKKEDGKKAAGAETNGGRGFSRAATQESAQKPEEKKDEAKDEGQEKKDEAKKPAPVEIDVAGLESRVVILPPKPGNYGPLSAVSGKILYRRAPRTGSADEKSLLVYYDLKEREEKTVLGSVTGFETTADGKKAFVFSDGKWAVIDIKENQKLDKTMRTSEMETLVDPATEWKQMFTDAYRFQRDYFYDPNLHGVDWKAVKDTYAKLIDASVTRWDVNYVLGEFIGELNASHTYNGGGDLESAPARGVGMLGVDWEIHQNTYRIKGIIGGGAWDADVRSPLAEPGVDVKAGHYVLAVNGAPLDVTRDPWAAFQGLADQTVVLTVNDKPTMDGSRQVVVKCLADEVELRFRDWIEQRRQHVEKATGGKAGYIYVQSTGVGAQNELVRQFMAQWRKDGLIIDERFNSGGQIPDRFIELLNRPLLARWAVRHGEDWVWPPVGHRGAKVMLINGWSGSGGDAFPFYFREAGLGPLIGTRTWGGLIGISGSPGLVDGGNVTVPTFRMYDAKGKWFAEGHGVDPDIPVDENPTELAKGIDPQLERAIQEVMARIKEQPALPSRPQYERRTAPATMESANQ